ncbi:MAG TPA: protoporphyrinogen oxidase [Candidatus Acidoferrum sp.]|nr:protoporphyrinogen oxidase [Candidatus Acidoferrum sp.]
MSHIYLTREFELVQEATSYIGLASHAVGYTERVVVIGAGISGLACAHRLKQLGLRPRVLEATERPGGKIATVRKDGFLFETGPQFPRFPSHVWQLVRDLNLGGEFVAGDPKAKRYIFRNDRLHLAPFSPGGLITTQLVGLKSKLRILAEPFGYSRPPDQEESLAEFVQRKFGEEILENLVDPIVSTVFLSDARRMGMESAFPALVEWERSQGSLVRGALRARRSKQDNSKPAGPSQPPAPRKDANGEILRVTDSLPTLGSFRSGMATLPERLAERLQGEITYKVCVESVSRSQESAGTSKPAWQIRLSSGEQITAQYLVLAVPAHVAVKLLETSAPQLASQLKDIEYAPICVVSSAYERSKVANRLDGFGFMVPRREGLNTICTFWNSSLFAGRAPERAVLITSFAAGEAIGKLGPATDEECVRTVEAENARILGISGEAMTRVVSRDPHALPQYKVGHAARVADIYRILRGLPNLYLAGNFLKGRSIGDCVEIGSRAAEDLHSQFERQDI